MGQSGWGVGEMGGGAEWVGCRGDGRGSVAILLYVYPYTCMDAYTSEGGSVQYKNKLLQQGKGVIWDNTNYQYAM